VVLQVKLQPASELAYIIHQVIVSHPLKSMSAQCRHDGNALERPYLMWEIGSARSSTRCRLI